MINKNSDSKNNQKTTFNNPLDNIYSKKIREKITKRKLAHEGNFLKMEKVYVTLPNGKEATRDVISHPGASAILVVDENKRILLEAQYRTPVDDIILEIPAGKLDAGEDPRDAAIRELKEETGLISNNLEKLGEIIVAAGYSDEIIHIYLAENVTEGEIQRDEDEFIELNFYEMSDVEEMIRKGIIKDSKTIAAICYLKLR